MKVLILGSNGMLGGVLRDVFADTDLTSWDKGDIDITDGDQVRQRIYDLRPDLVINAAAYTDVDGAEEERELAFSVNETGVRNIASVVSGMDIPLVHYSTDYVFPGDNRDGYTEQDAPGPAVNAYGASKLAGERALREEGARFYLLRTAWLYGPYGHNFVETMLRLARERDTLTVVHDQVGSPTYTKDVARATRQLIDEGYEPGIYHTVNSGRASWYEFTQKIVEFSQDITVDIKPVSSDEFPRAAARPAYSILQNTQGPAMRRWEDALAEYLEER